MDPLHLAIALGPLSVYLVLLGAIHLAPRPFVTSGSRDAAALGVGIGGLVVAGPLELFVPESFVFIWGALVWVLLLLLYGLCLTLHVLVMRPRIVIYNVRREVVRPLLANLVTDLDREARWAGDCLTLPRLGVQLHIEASPAMRVVQLVAAGPQQNYEGWRRLQMTLMPALRQTPGTRHHLGYVLVGCGIAMVALMSLLLVLDPQTVQESLVEMLRW